MNAGVSPGFTRGEHHLGRHAGPRDSRAHGARPHRWETTMNKLVIAALALAGTCAVAYVGYMGHKRYYW